MIMDYLERDRELYEERQSDCYKVYLVTVDSKIVFNSDDYEEAYSYFLEEKGASLSEAIEFGYVWDGDFDPRKLKETYRLIEIIEQ